jgi:predicted flap endonuclease-1-like 5' DNA nuclease
MLSNKKPSSTANNQKEQDSDDQSELIQLKRTKPTAARKAQTQQADNLKAIKGVSAAVEKSLNAAGIIHYRQIARFTEANVNWVNHHLGYTSRVQHENWVEQAKQLAKEQEIKNLGGEVSDDMKPNLLSGPDGEADDFKRIKGIGLVLEQSLNELGIYHYYQLATLTFNNVRWIEHQVGFPGRVQREDWIAQARDLARGNVTEYSSRFDKGKTPYSA